MSLPEDHSRGGWDAHSRGGDWWESRNWDGRSRGWDDRNADGNRESQGRDGGAGDRSRGATWENRDWNDRWGEGGGWGSGEGNHSRGWEEQGTRCRAEPDPSGAVITVVHGRRPKAKAGPPRAPGKEIATPAAFRVALDDKAPVGAGCGAEGCPCGSATVVNGQAQALLDLSFFQQWKGQVPHWREHNAALKWLRSVHESPGGFALPLEVQKCKIQHWEGTSYSFLEETETWSWVSMVASLDEASMRSVVTNDGLSRGLFYCSFSPRPNSYDHASSKALRDEGLEINTKMSVWDFLLIRDDGSGIRLHPEWTKTKVRTCPPQGSATEKKTPQGGFGESAGKGSFQDFLNHGVDRIVRFDANKIKRMQASNAAVADADSASASGSCNAAVADADYIQSI